MGHFNDNYFNESAKRTTLKRSLFARANVVILYRLFKTSNRRFNSGANFCNF